MKRIKKKPCTSRVIEFLLQRKLITQEHLNDVKYRQNGTLRAQRSLYELLVEMEYISEENLMEAISSISDIPVFYPDREQIDLSVVKLISDKLAKRYNVFPIRREGDTLILAMTNPNNVIALDEIGLIAQMKIKPLLAKKRDITRCIEKHYHLEDNLYDILRSLKDEKTSVVNENEAGRDIFELKDNRYKSSVAVRLANFILGDAIKLRASDIHVEPQRYFTIVRYRIDGKLKSMMKIPKLLHSALAARIKILTKLDIAECKKPQDGRVRILIDDRGIDLRISTIPTFHGEKIAMRLLDSKEAKVEIDKLGLQREEFDVLVRAVSRAQGMILATGPTSSGKTSTLYAALNFIKSETKNIVTIEDPIEYLIENISQMQVNPARDVTFANGLRHILRQDPNVVLVGEIRDKEAAEIAFRASMTGHLVFSTLHTNSSVSSITRLLNMGLEPGVISSSLILVISQRLVRINCSFCKEKYTPSKKLLDEFSVYIDRFGIDRFFRGAGCERCNFTGYFGRTAIFEILRINEKIKALISNRANESEILKEARKNGLKPLVESGIEKVAMGITTLGEVASWTDGGEEERQKSKPINGAYKFNGTSSNVRDIIYPEDLIKLDDLNAESEPA